MALISCPSCGKNISSKAHKCPKCGYELKNGTPKADDESTAITIGIFICVIILILAILIGSAN